MCSCYSIHGFGLNRPDTLKLQVFLLKFSLIKRTVSGTLACCLG